jgi:hypothetical protein
MSYGRSLVYILAGKEGELIIDLGVDSVIPPARTVHRATFTLAFWATDELGRGSRCGVASGRRRPRVLLVSVSVTICGIVSSI